MPRQRHIKLFIFIIVLAGLLWGFPPGIQQARAQIGLENTASSVAFDAANPTINLTVTSATLVLVHVMTKDGTAATNVSDSVDGDYTRVDNAVAGDTGTPPRVETWYLADPTPGPRTITVTIGACLGITNAFGLTGTDTTYPIGAASSSTGTGSPASNPIGTLYDNSWIISLVGVQAGGSVTEDISGGQTSIWERVVGGGPADRRSAEVTYELKETHGSDTQSWTISSTGNWALGSVEVKVPGGTPDVVLADHEAGQVTNQFYGATDLYGAYLFAFQLTNNTGDDVTVNQVQFQLSSVNGIDLGVPGPTDFHNLALYVDDNGNGVIDETETTTVGGGGTVADGGDGTFGTITFNTTPFAISSGTTYYILKGDVSNLQSGDPADSVTIDLGTSDITVPSFTVEGSDATSVTHTYCGDGKFSYYREITIDHTLVDGTSGALPATGFPVLISLTATHDGNWIKTTDQTGGHIESADGYDIIFRDSDNQTQLYHEIEDYDGATGTLVAWVRIDSLSKENDTTIYMYYGNKCNNSPTGNPAKVWDDNYVGVWHLTDLHDSTENPDPNNGTDSGTSNTTGQIADARNFDANSDFITIGNRSTLQPAQLTFSCWVKRPTGTNWTGKQNVFNWLKGATYDTDGWYVDCDDDPSHTTTDRPLNLVVDGANTFSINGIDPDAFYDEGAWTYIAVTFDSGATPMAKAYKDTVSQTFTSADNPLSITSTGDTKYLSAASGLGSGIIGDMDEVRISKSIRDADWIRTSFNNQNDPGNFMTVSVTEESAAATAVSLASFTARGQDGSVLVVPLLNLGKPKGNK